MDAGDCVRFCIFVISGFSVIIFLVNNRIIIIGCLLNPFYHHLIFLILHFSHCFLSATTYF